MPGIRRGARDRARSPGRTAARSCPGHRASSTKPGGARAAGGPCPSNRAGTTDADPRRARRAPGGGEPLGLRERASPRVRRQSAAASRTEIGSASVGSGTADHLSPSSSTNREPVDASSVCARLAISTTRSRARPDHAESRRSSSSRARFRSDWDTSRSRASRSNIGSGLVRLRKFPSTVPTTRTVWNSRPTAPWAVSTWTASVSGAPTPRTGPRSPASTEARKASTDGSAAEPASATALEKATTESSSRRESMDASAASTNRREQGSSATGPRTHPGPSGPRPQRRGRGRLAPLRRARPPRR